jgi:4-aminobutyrate aminotransferase
MTEYVCKKPGPKSVRVIKRDEKVIAPCITREYSFVYKKAKGVYIWDADDKKYLDFAAAVAVMNIGHDNPEVGKAIREQYKYGAHCGFADFYAEVPVRFAEKLLLMLPKALEQGRVFLSNSGTEAVEAAYKLARYHKNKKWTIAFRGAFHGRTMGSLSMTNSRSVQRERYEPFLPVMHVPYPNWYRMRMEPEECADYCLAGLERTMQQVKNDLACVFIEPIQGEGGYVVPPKGFVSGVRKLCDEYNALLCDDEVQAGCFRTGKFLAIENFGVTPDVVSLSKAIGGGIPLGATVAGEKIMKGWTPGSHANTFGGNLLACAGGIAALEFMKKKKLGQNAIKRGAQIMKRLHEWEEEYEIVGNVRGIGLMIGIEIVKSKDTREPDPEVRDAIICRALEKRLLLLPAGESVVRICPPLIISKEEADKGLDTIELAIRAVQKR